MNDHDDKIGDRMMVAVLAITALLIGATYILVDRALDAPPSFSEVTREAIESQEHEADTDFDAEAWCHDTGGRVAHTERGVICLFGNNP